MGTRFRKSLPLLFTLLIVAALGILTMPKELYPGDNHGIRLAATNFYLNGDIGIDYSLRDSLYPYLEAKGQVFLENDERQKFYSRWGELNTLLFTIPEMIRRPTQLNLIFEEVIVYADAMSVVFSLLAAIYLFLLVRCVGGSPWASAMLVLCCFYGSFLWVYLRAQTYEVVHLFLFTGYVYHVVRHVQKAQRRLSMDLLVSQILLFMLVLSKSTFFVLYGPTVLTLWQMRMRKELGAVFAFCATALSVHLGLVYWKTGIFQLTTEGASFPNTPNVFSYKNIIPRLRDYTVNVKSSLFSMFPQLGFALVFWPGFWKEKRIETQFILMTIAINLALFLLFYARGEICYGPRYFTFLLPLMSLPLVRLLDDKSWRSRVLCVSLVLVSLFVARLHYNFNSRSTMLYSQLTLWVLQAGDPAPARAYLSSYGDAQIATAFNKFLAGDSNSFPPVDIFIKDPTDRSKLESARVELAQKLPCNFYFTFMCPKVALEN